ncbi:MULTISPECIES: helicase-related protein [Streptomyces]|uniref:helicase-related protein n=1 Tax=Streptomyces TaxID=1883 RepID=UPI0003A1FCB7|nr:MULTISPECIES: helicase-related protein [Streptomyces]MBZ6114570.1 DEAD/DEAH box helicase family protein [Streptomyces olivaceus]MBZ6128441.1 DEAD/DEAH box helicase family protein [Streptomyces olivaceus]MBZ6149275.1 DEAD/DEAH box helicase family protein [Streptomyces olivaceus]MBZ6163205.1 DEAD/DEAH box helicase family protein [Streptomyces olivaceus]MBZ6191009.1 DEAD/DEAH box helicase family protein [Streptomyces olivaceus]
MALTYSAGSLVTARGREWVVLPESEPDLLVLRPLGGSDDDIAAVFPAFETVKGAEFAPPEPGDLGDQRAAGLLRTALRVGFRSGAGPFRSLAGIAVEPRAYQLVPLLMALRQKTVRMLISDDVGIGKTVEAGLIASELLAQGEATGLAVLCSPALAEQWQQELRTKFGIDAELVLSSTVSRLERRLDLGQSLFDKYPHVIVSTDFIKSTRHRDDFVRHCPDLVIVDEAHTCVTSDDTKVSTQNQLRYELLRRVAENADRHLLLVTATPHSGKESAFRKLLGLVKPDLAQVDLDSEKGRKLLAQHFVARKRADVRQYLTKEDGLADDSLAERTAFPSDRYFKDETYKLSPEYRALLDDAIAYASERVEEADGQGRREARIAWWSAIALLRSMVSSPRAAAQTLRTRSAAAVAASAEEADRLGAPLTSDSADSDALEGMDVAPGAETEENAGSRLADLAERAQALEGPAQDLKLKALIKHLKALLADGYNPIVFCRYIPTAEYLAEQLGNDPETKKRGPLGAKTVVKAVTGTLSPQQRIERIEELAAEAGEDAAARRVLIATDCLSEGVNLQHHFDSVLHYDLAWNPTRHDQREGRVDRYGQKRDEVRVITLYGDDNGIDGKVLEVLIKKHRQIKKDLGISVSVPDEMSTGVTDAIVEWLLLRGRQGEQEALFESDSFQQSFADLEQDWNSAADREKASRSRFAQRSIHPEEVAREVAAVREALGGAGEVDTFVRESLNALGAVLRDSGASVTDFTAQVGGAPVGLRDALAPVVGAETVERDRPIPFRSSPAVTRGEAALVRTDPVVVALASHVLNAALDTQADGARPARRCGVVTTDAVTTRTTLLLVRYRFHLTLPSRNGEKQVVAEDARLLAFEGAPRNAVWLPQDRAVELLEARATENTAAASGERTMKRVLGELGDATAHLESYGDELAAELDASHRRVRTASGEIVRGLSVTAQKPADILGTYVYLPAASSTVSASAGVSA